MTQTATSTSTQTVELWYQGDLVGCAVRDSATASFVLEAANEELGEWLIRRDIHRFITEYARRAA